MNISLYTFLGFFPGIKITLSFICLIFLCSYNKAFRKLSKSTPQWVKTHCQMYRFLFFLRDSAPGALCPLQILLLQSGPAVAQDCCVLPSQCCASPSSGAPGLPPTSLVCQALFDKVKNSGCERFSFFKSSLEDIFSLLFREKRRERGRERKKHQYKRGTLISCPPNAWTRDETPNLGMWIIHAVSSL